MIKVTAHRDDTDVRYEMTIEPDDHDEALPDGRKAYRVTRELLEQNIVLGFPSAISQELWAQLGLLPCRTDASYVYFVEACEGVRVLDDVVAKMHPKPGDVIVFTSRWVGHLPIKKMYDRLKEACPAWTAAHGLMLMISPDDEQDLRLLPEERARELYEQLKRRFA